MKIISHRGNLDGPQIEFENEPSYIEKALNIGLDVEIDVWSVDGKLYLGHDKPIYNIDVSFLFNNYNRLWCHAKNVEALQFLLNGGMHCFWHENDKYTITSKGKIWVYPGQPLIKGCVALFDSYTKEELKVVYGICSDNPLIYK